MNSKKGLPKAAIILYAILITFTCLSCEFYPETMFDGLKEAKVPLYLPELDPTAATQSYKVALNFGIASGDALACIYNEDRAALRRCMGMVYDYAKHLGIPEIVLSELGRINAAMDQGDWNKVLRLSGGFGDNVITELEKTGKKDDASLAFVAWHLEGLYIAAKSLNNRFSPEASRILRNVSIVKDLEKGLQSLSVDLKTKKEVKALMAALPKINQIINRPENYAYTQADIKELISICEPLRQTLVSD